MSKQSALFLMVLVTLIWSANGLLIKLVDWPPMAISGLRSLFAVMVLLPFMGKPNQWLSLSTLAGGAGFAGALITFVVATKLTTAANAIFLQLTAPVYENPALLEQLAAQTTIGRNGVLSDLDGLTVFLASPASDYLTGQVIHLDGGFTAK